MQVITSKDNETVKHIRKLKDKKYRDEYNEYIIEGIKLVKEAIEEKVVIKTIIICDGCDKSSDFDSKLLYEMAKMNCAAVPENIFNTLTDVVNPQGILAVVSRSQKSDVGAGLASAKNQMGIDYKQDLIVILDNIQDPGNLGTVLRTVDSANLKQIIVTKGTVDAYGSKVVRSTMGAIFRVNIIEVDSLESAIKEVKAHKFKIIGTDLRTDKTIYDIEYKKTAVIIGNEAKGIEENILNLTDERVKIPMLGKTESLNASVATGIVIYEYVRQKVKK